MSGQVSMSIRGSGTYQSGVARNGDNVAQFCLRHGVFTEKMNLAHSLHISIGKGKSAFLFTREAADA